MTDTERAIKRILACAMGRRRPGAASYDQSENNPWQGDQRVLPYAKRPEDGGFAYVETFDQGQWRAWRPEDDACD